MNKLFIDFGIIVLNLLQAIKYIFKMPVMYVKKTLSTNKYIIENSTFFVGNEITINSKYAIYFKNSFKTFCIKYFFSKSEYFVFESLIFSVY